MRTLFVSLLTVIAASALDAETYKVNLFQTTEVAGQRLAAGTYRLEIEGAKAFFRQGKMRIEVPVQSQPATPLDTTAIHYDTSSGIYRIREINPKGAPVKLTFGEQTASR